MNDDFLHDYRRKPPAETMDSLWARLAEKEQQPTMIQQTEKQPTKTNWLRLGWAAAAVTLIAVALALPPVRALAQEIIDLFRRAETATVTVSAEQGEAMAAAWTRYESLADLEAAAGKVRLLPVQVLPGSYALENTARRSDGMIYLGYRPLDVQGLLALTEQTAEDQAADDFPTNQIGPEATVEVFELSGVQVQYVTGGWQGEDEPGVLTWTSDPTTRMLRWEQNGTVYTLWVGGDPSGPIAIDQDAMLAAAGAMIDGVEAVLPDVPGSGLIETDGVTWDPATYAQAESDRFAWTYEEPTPAAGFQSGLTLEEASTLGGYPVPEPTSLPDGFALREASYLPALDAVSLVYGWQDNDMRIVTLTVQPADRLADLLAQEATDPSGVISPVADVLQVDVNGAQGELVRGSWSWSAEESPDPGQVIIVRWEDRLPYTRLRWEQDGLILTLTNPGDAAGQVDIATLLAIARSVK